MLKSICAHMRPRNACITVHEVAIIYQSVGDVFITGKYHVKQVILTLFPQNVNSALILAAWFGHTDTVMELVKAGAKLDLQDKV